MSQIYRHLDFRVNEYGDIIRIYNGEEIKKKWEKVKEHLTYKHPLNTINKWKSFIYSSFC